MLISPTKPLHFSSYFPTVFLIHILQNSFAGKILSSVDCPLHSLHIIPHSQRHYSQGWASTSFKSFLHPSRFRATTVQFLHPGFAASSFSPSSPRNLGLPLWGFPPGSLRRTFLDKSSSWCMTSPAHLYLLNLQNSTMSFSTT